MVSIGESDVHVNAALVGELDGVVGQIDQHLMQAFLVPVKGARNVLVDVSGEFEPLLLSEYTYR
jgi:hypothetical protein